MRKLIKKILRESEEDPFKWIKDTQPINYEYLKGKALYFQPPIDNDRDLNRILDYLENLGFEVGYALRHLDSLGIEMNITGLYLNPNNNAVTWTDGDYLGEDYEEHISEWAGIPVEVLDGWQTLGGYI